MKMRRDEAIETSYFSFLSAHAVRPMKMRRDEAIETFSGNMSHWSPSWPYEDAP